jgi:MarR-like DNA-binding transcriptional regulator SgrR of sgrS sRNA
MMGIWKQVPIIDWLADYLDKRINWHHSRSMGAINTIIIMLACHSQQECNTLYNHISKVDKQEIIIQTHRDSEKNHSSKNDLTEE